MTLVTTSRKPVSGLRTLGKDIAFTLGVKYTPRGKTGFLEILELDNEVILVSKMGRKFLLQLYVDGEVVCECPFTSYGVEKRSTKIVMGLRTGNQTVYECLGRYLNVHLTEEGEGNIVFDGIQGRTYVLRLPKNARS